MDFSRPGLKVVRGHPTGAATVSAILAGGSNLSGRNKAAHSASANLL